MVLAMVLAVCLSTLACDGGATTSEGTTSSEATSCAGTSSTATSGAAAPETAHGQLTPGEPVWADLDGDGDLEQIAIDPQDDSLTITDGSVFYRSRDKWRVVQALLGDTDRDGLTEVVALLDSEKGRHLGLFAYFGGAYRERFVTQAIDPAPTAIEVVKGEATDQAAGDSAGGGSASDVGEAGGDLVALVQLPADGGSEPQKTLLRWNGFGYTRVETSPSTE